jgi:hypothetical protein
MDPQMEWQMLSIEKMEKTINENRSMNIIGFVSLAIFIIGLLINSIFVKGTSGIIYLAVAFPILLLVLLVLAIRYREPIKYMVYISEMQEYVKKEKNK